MFYALIYFMKKEWIGSQSIKKLVLVILSKESREVMERWEFIIQIQKDLENEHIRYNNYYKFNLKLL